MDISGKTFIITGAARGLGLAMAQSMVQQDANVLLADRDETGLQAALNTLPANAGRQIHCVADVSNEASVTAMFDLAQSELGPVAGLVNNAGIMRDALLVNGREAAKRMIQSQTAGVIINISSISRAGNAGQSNYAAAKAGVTALTVTWARELARHGIRVAAIAPGVFETEMVASMSPETRERFVSTIPLKRTGELSDLADAMNFIFKN